jgi:hypothetical protein
VRWVESTVTEPSYFKLCTEHTPIHLALLDEVVTCHILLHPKVLQLLIQLFDELEILVQVCACPCIYKALSVGLKCYATLEKVNFWEL